MNKTGTISQKNLQSSSGPNDQLGFLCPHYSMYQVRKKKKTLTKFNEIYKDQCLLGENVLTDFVSIHIKSFLLLLDQKKNTQNNLEIYNRGDLFL